MCLSTVSDCPRSSNIDWLRLIASAVISLGIFAMPVRDRGKETVPFDWVVRGIVSSTGRGAEWFAFGLIAIGAIATFPCLMIVPDGLKKNWTCRIVKIYSCSLGTGLLRIAGLGLAVCMSLNIGPTWLIVHRPVMWNTLTVTVGVIIPLGASLMAILANYGAIEIVGGIMQPIMRPLFRLPGRSAVDDFTSWIGPYSVGLYLTRTLFDRGYYSRREAYVIATCFSTVSVGFVAVICSTLNLLNRFPLVMFTYFIAVYGLTVALVRIWPLANVAGTYVGPPNQEPDYVGPFFAHLKRTLGQALLRAKFAKPMLIVAGRGFIDGLRISTTILGTILAVGTLTLILNRQTAVFEALGRPIAPCLGAMGIPEAGRVAPATLVGMAEVYLPALLVKDNLASEASRFFVAVLSISQLIFFSSVGPMILDMFCDIPAKVVDLVALFLMRTAILIPAVAAITALYVKCGLLQP